MKAIVGLGQQARKMKGYHKCFRGYAETNTWVKDKCIGQPFLSHSSHYSIAATKGNEFSRLSIQLSTHSSAICLL